MKKTVGDRFWSKVQKSDGCWLWTAAVSADGYGEFANPYGLKRAHRVSWFIHHGQIPDGLHVLHRCDRPSCVRPEHLFLGTHQDNMRDRDRKGRQYDRNHEKHPRAIITHDIAHEMRVAHLLGAQQREIARVFGVKECTVNSVIVGKNWTATPRHA